MTSIPTKMFALVSTRYAAPDALQYTKVPVPIPQDHQVLIKVNASSVNALDWRLCRGDPFLIRPMMGGLCYPRRNFILGADVAGIIAAVGKKVTNWQVGDPVVTDTSYNKRFAAFAEYALADATMLVRKPSSLSFEQVAGLPVAANTAWEAVKKFEIKENYEVLINGASGGVGLYAVQLAKMLGGRVTAVCSSTKMDLVREAGADEVIDHTQTDFTQEKKQYNYIVDVVAMRPWSEIKKVLDPQGHYVVVGGSLSKIIGFSMKRDGRVGIVDSKANVEHLQNLIQLMEQGKIKTFIDHVYPLSEAARAVEHVDSGQVRGKVIISTGESTINMDETICNS